MEHHYKVNFILYMACFILLISLSRFGYANQTVKLFEGYWVYGFEQSLLETCNGKLYWMWTPAEFEGKYKQEGYRNPVRVTGYLFPPNPQDNMKSPLGELKVVAIEHTRVKC